MPGWRAAMTSYYEVGMMRILLPLMQNNRGVLDNDAVVRFALDLCISLIQQSATKDRSRIPSSGSKPQRLQYTTAGCVMGWTLVENRGMSDQL
jgi:hypothetical protein